MTLDHKIANLARRFQVFVETLLEASHVPICALSSVHLSEFVFNRVASG